MLRIIQHQVEQLAPTVHSGLGGLGVLRLPADRAADLAPDMPEGVSVTVTVSPSGSNDPSSTEIVASEHWSGSVDAATSLQRAVGCVPDWITVDASAADLELRRFRQHRLR